jgi:membrane-bound lytic murein transglycosylase B
MRIQQLVPLLPALLCIVGLLATPAHAMQDKPRPQRHNRAVKALPSKPYGQRADLMSFARQLAEANGWDVGELQQQLARAERNPTVQRLMMPPPAGTAKDWAAYRKLFVEPRRMQAGLAFWRDNAATLDRATQRYGVPADIIVGLIGVETYYGQIMGGFRIIDALTTLGFDFPRGRKDRSEFFRNELGEFLLLARREGIDPFSLKGSYAGAIGLPQFMPGSWNRFAIDFDGDGKIDLINNPADAIGSVARYLAEHGWQRGMPTHFEVRVPVDSSARAQLLAPDIVPSFRAAQMIEQGAELPEAARQLEGPLALVELQNGKAAPSYVAGTANFYALTRYNWSSYYAMGVIELGAAIAKLRP